MILTTLHRQAYRLGKTYPAAYIRRSVARRGDTGDVSREFQIAKVRALANGHGPNLRILDGDWGRSAATDRTNQRLAFLAMLDDIERGNVSHVYAYAPDRLARSVEWSARLVNVCRRAGVPITTTAGTVAPDDPAARAMFNMLAVMNETALDEMERKAKAAAETVKANGKTVGQRPYGEKRERKDGTIAGLGEDAELVVATWRETGSYFAAARALNERGIPARSGRQWYPRTVQRIVNRRNHATVPLTHRRGVRSFGARRLAGLLRCHCGATLGQTTSHWAIKYRCPNGVADRTHGRYIVSEDALMPVIREEANRLHVPWDALEEERTADEVRVANLEAKRNRIVDMAADGIIDKIEAKRRLAAVDEDVAAIGARSVVQAIPPEIPWNAPEPELNAVLRALWDRVELDEQLIPKRFVWRVPEWRS